MADAQPASDPVIAPPALQPVAHLDALPPATRLAEFEIQGLLGVGGFGLVYRAYDHSLHRTVAIKEYMPAALASRAGGLNLSIRSSTDQATYDSGLRSFMAEARLLAQFDHPSLVKVYRFWEANNTAYMVMPLYSGMTLKQARARMTAPPPEAWLRTVLWSILQALQVLHEHDTLHRDVSPDNIFLQDAGPPVLLDLGAARRAIADRSRKLTAILKVNYAPIEHYAEVEDLQQGPWTDLYALAAVIYGCLRNDAPLPATTRVVSDSMPSLQSVASTIEAHYGIRYSPAFVRAIAHALTVQPAARTRSVGDFVAEMGLEAPPGLLRFDWRAGLGGDLLPHGAGDDAADARTTVQNPTLALPVQTLIRTQAPAATPFPARSRWRPRWVWVLLLGLVLAAGSWVYDGVLGDSRLVEAPERPAVPVTAVMPAAAEPADAAPARPPAPPAAPAPDRPTRPPTKPPAPASTAKAPAKPDSAPKELCA
ncbi:MAG: serine/threonine-protein kinase, partial [Curvibacter sp.]